MLTVFVNKTGNYTNHGVRNEQGGSGSTGDNGWSIKMATRVEVARYFKLGDQYLLEVNGINKGVFTA